MGAAKYMEMRDKGISAVAIYQAAEADGLDQIQLLRLVRELFGYSLVEAKEVGVIADGRATSLFDYQAQLIPALEALLIQDEGIDS